MLSRIWIFFILGILFTIIGTITVCIWPNILHSIVSKQLPLSNHSQSYNTWKDSTMPLKMEIYLFNWTNPYINKNGSLMQKPNVVQLGPYVFREQRHKIIVDWNDMNQTVTYFQNRTWYFDPMLSTGSLDDLVTTVNVPAIAAAYGLRKLPSYELYLINVLFGGIGIKIHATKTVREFVFDGYTNPIMDITGLIPKKYLPFAIPFDKFGWFYTRNGSATYDGVFNMETGSKNIHLLGKLSNWNYENTTKYYSSYCGNVNGSAGELFGPWIQKTKIEFYSPDLCRPIMLKYSKEIKSDNISSYRFIGDPQIFYNKTYKPDNWCYYGEDPNESNPNGILDISICKWGAPIFASFPHFYEADPVYREAVTGMNPDPEQHQFIIDVEPLTGVPVHASAGIQINVHVNPNEHFTFLKNMPNIFFPCIWFKEIADVAGDTEQQLKHLSSLSVLPLIIGYLIISVGITALIIIGIIFIAHRCRRQDSDSYLIAPNICDDDGDD